jgi:hypothetical protein
MPEKIGKRHLARENERNGMGEETQYNQRATDEFDRSARPRSENNVTSLNSGTAGNFSSFAIPYCRNSSPVMMRRTLKTQGCQET